MATGLSKAVPREHLHTREIRCRGFRRTDGLWDIEGLLEDTKTYSFDNHDRAGVASGEPVHRMHMRLTIDDELAVNAVEAATEAGPFSICGDINAAFAGLAGLKIGPGWRKAVLGRLGGVHGCTHLTELLLGPMTTTAWQTVFAARQRRENTQPSGKRPAMIDTCHALAGDGPIVRRQWPDHYTGTDAADG